MFNLVVVATRSSITLSLFYIPLLQLLISAENTRTLRFFRFLLPSLYRLLPFSRSQRTRPPFSHCRTPNCRPSARLNFPGHRIDTSWNLSLSLSLSSGRCSPRLTLIETRRPAWLVDPFPSCFTRKSETPSLSRFFFFRIVEFLV